MQYKFTLSETTNDDEFKITLTMIKANVLLARRVLNLTLKYFTNNIV